MQYVIMINYYVQEHPQEATPVLKQTLHNATIQSWKFYSLISHIFYSVVIGI